MNKTLRPTCLLKHHNDRLTSNSHEATLKIRGQGHQYNWDLCRVNASLVIKYQSNPYQAYRDVVPGKTEKTKLALV